jgi:hypothetical protein
MMRRIVSMCAAVATIAIAPAHAGELQGTWTASLQKEHPGRIDFSLQTGRNDQHGSRFTRSDFAGLSSAEIESKSRVPVRFELEREAGTITFEGTFRDGRGGGDFTFVPDADYVRKLRSVGVRFEAKHGDEDREMLNLALFDVSIPFIRSMQALGYDETIDKYVAFRIFGVDPDYVHDMESVGFENLSADKLVETRIHGATPEYIREMRADGENLRLDQYIESRIFQITPEFAKEMRHAGYPGLKRDLLVQFKIHGVSPTFVRELREAGYSRLSAEKLVEMRIHGVTPEFIRRVEKAGYRNVPVDKLVQMRIFNIDPEMVRALDDGDR